MPKANLFEIISEAALALSTIALGSFRRSIPDLSLTGVGVPVTTHNLF